MDLCELFTSSRRQGNTSQLQAREQPCRTTRITVQHAAKVLGSLDCIKGICGSVRQNENPTEYSV